MKKILAIILCAALVIGMIPAAFAATEETDTLEYVFSEKGLAQGNVSFSGYYRMKAGYNYENVSVYFIEESRVGAANNGITFKINVNTPGLYIPEFNYLGTKYGGIVDIYILSKTDADNNSWSMTVANNSYKGDNGTQLALSDYAANGEDSVVKKIISARDTYNENNTDEYTEYNHAYSDNVSGEALELLAGEHYVIFSISARNENANTFGSYNGSTVSIESLKLTKLTPASVEVSADATEIDAGGTAKLTSVVKTADGTEIPAKVNYSSSNSIVTVDENGNVTTGNTAGKVTITATVDGTTVSDSVEITVTKSYNYVFWASARTEGASLGASDYLSIPAGGAGYNMVEGASEPWDYMVQYSVSSWACRKKENATRFSAEIIDGVINSTNMFAYKVKFSEKGKYIPTLYYQPYIAGGKVQVFLVPATWAESGDGFGEDGILNENTEGLSIISGARVNNKCIGEADTYSSAASPSTAVINHTTFAETEITEDEYYLLFSMSGANENAEPFHNTSKNTYHHYAYLSSLSFKKVGEIENVEAPTVALAVAYGDEDPTVTSYPRGKEITVTAPDKTDENLTFRHWVRGTADGGDWITNDASYTFTLATNTYLTAVYTVTTAETDKIVEFWGGNGEYLTEKKAGADGKVEFPDDPKMTGFEFLQWIVAKNTPVTADTVFENAITRVVAEFGDDEDVKFAVDGTDYVYDTKIHKEENTEKAWYRDDVLVGYGDTYDYHVWDAVGSIEARDISGEKTPLVVLDGTVKEEKACMIEYDTAGKDVTEVGIVFGTSSATIDSCNSKATSQKKLSHGQFTAKPNKNGNASYARGYIIYNDAGVYRVTYTNPVALNS